LYRGHLLPKDCHLLVPLKQNLVDHEFNDSFESYDKMADKKDTDWYQDGLENLVPRYEKCLDFSWDWAGK
jgi:hypothetical protein